MLRFQKNIKVSLRTPTRMKLAGSRRLFLERFERREMLAADTVTMQQAIFDSCNVEVDHSHTSFIDNASKAAEERHFSIVSYNTDHVPTSVADAGHVFTRCPGDVPGGSGGSDQTIREFNFPQEKLVVKLVDMPDPSADPMEVQVGATILTADRIELYREISPGDFRGIFAGTADSFVRPATLPNNPLHDAKYGLSLAVGPLTAQVLPSGETVHRGQVQRVKITPGELPTLEYTYRAGGWARLQFAKITAQETRIDVVTQHPSLTRFLVIGSIPQTLDQLQSDDVWADFSDMLVRTADAPLLVGHATDFLTPVQNVASVAFNQNVKSHHNSLDASFVIHVGAGLQSDGLGDIALSEAEDGVHSSNEPSRAHASGNLYDHKTVDLVQGQTTTGFLATAGRSGYAVPFVRYSLDLPFATVADTTFAGENMQFTFHSTRTNDTPAAGGTAWDWFDTVYGEPIYVTADNLPYSLTMQNGHTELDVVGLLFLGDELTLSTTTDLLSENGGSVVLTVTRSVFSVADSLVVNLASNLPGAVSLPANVTIPAGETFVNVTIQGLNNALPTGTQTVSITATAGAATSAPIALLVSDDELPFQNSRNRLDVNNDGIITAIDVLLVINVLNTFTGGVSAQTAQQLGPFFHDVNGTNDITALDALVIINYLNVNPISSAGEDVAMALALPASAVAGESDDATAFGNGGCGPEWELLIHELATSQAKSTRK